MSNDFHGRNQNTRVYSKLRGEGEQEGENQRKDEELERAMRMDGTIPGTSDEFVKQVSSRAYDMRRHLQQSFDSSSYDGKVALSNQFEFCFFPCNCFLCILFRIILL